jgi:ribose transport system substrate-binding protein
MYDARPMKRAAKWWMALVVGAGLAGGACKKQQTNAIAVIPKGTTHEFWKSVHAGALRAAGELGVEILWKGPQTENDRDAQIAEVENFTNRGVSAIVLAPLDENALRKPVAAAVARRIPVVIFDSALQGEGPVSFVATDNLKGGRIAGVHLARLLGGRGRVAMLRYMEGSASTSAREAGFLEAAKDAGLEVVSDNQYAGATGDSAQKAAENLLGSLKTPDGGLKVDGLFCPNESSTFGMLRALQGAGLAGKVKFCGFDSSEKLVAALKAGELHGAVLQDPVKMGYLAVKTAVEHLRGAVVEGRIDTGAVLVSPDNMEQPDMKALLHPERAP